MQRYLDRRYLRVIGEREERGFGDGLAPRNSAVRTSSTKTK